MHWCTLTMKHGINLPSQNMMHPLEYQYFHVLKRIMVLVAFRKQPKNVKTKNVRVGGEGNEEIL